MAPDLLSGPLPAAAERGVWVIPVDAAQELVFGGGPPVPDRLATSVQQMRRDQKELGLTESDTGRSRFLLSSGCNRSGYY